MWTLAFWKATVERALATAAEVFGGLLLAYGISAGLDDVNWGAAFSVTGLATLLSVVKSIGAGALTDGGPSLSNAEVLSPPAPQPPAVPPQL